MKKEVKKYQRDMLAIPSLTHNENVLIGLFFLMNYLMTTFFFSLVFLHIKIPRITSQG